RVKQGLEALPLVQVHYYAGQFPQAGPFKAVFVYTHEFVYKLLRGKRASGVFRGLIPAGQYAPITERKRDLAVSSSKRPALGPGQTAHFCPSHERNILRV